MGLVTLLLINVNLSGVLGGPKDKPIIFRAGGMYGVYVTEDYWKQLFEENGGGTLTLGAPTGEYLRLDMVLTRFTPPEKYKYAPTEKLRKAIVFVQDFIAPKAFYVGYNIGMYNMKGTSDALGEIKWQNIPMGISLGIINGMSPWQSYTSVGGGMILATEDWDLKTKLLAQTGDSTMKDKASCSGWYGMAEMGITRQLRGYLALDLFAGYNYFIINYTVGEPVPLLKNPSKKEVIQQAEVGIGLIFAFPWYSEKTVW